MSFQIDWYDPWLIALIVGHVITTATAICTRNYSLFQVILFMVMCEYSTAAYPFYGNNMIITYPYSIAVDFVRLHV